MRVLLVTRAGTGGAGRHVRDLVAGLSGKHEILALASPTEDPAFLDALAAAGARVTALPLARGPRPIEDLAALLAIRRAVRRDRPDVVHAHTAKPGALARIAAGRAPVVYSPHGFFHDYPTAPAAARRAALAAERALAPRTAVLAVCAAFEEDLARRRGLAAFGRTVVVPNGVPAPAPLPPPERAAIRAALGAGPGDFLALMAGRLAAPKDAATFCAAAALLPPGFRAVLAGDGPLRASLPASPAALLGTRADAGRLLLAADAAVLCSRFEAAPYFVLEAMAAGVPVIATDLPATREALAGTGLLVPGDDPDALAAALRRLRSDSALARGLADAARSRAAIDFSPARMFEAVERAWSLAVGSRRESQRFTNQ